MPELIRKRDGHTEPWDPTKIRKAIEKALAASEEDLVKSEILTEEVVSRVNGARVIGLEDVQDYVEETLMNNGLTETAKRFIIYRETRSVNRKTEHVMCDVTEMVGDYLTRDDWRVNENSNMDYSVQGLILGISGGVQARWTLSQMPEEVRTAHNQGKIHIHDLSFGLSPYCCGWSTYDLLFEGFNAPGFCHSGPPHHFDSALSQMINFIGTLQNEWAGAQAFNNIDTYLAPFIRKDNLSYKQICQDIQRFLFNLNTTSRWGGQSPFSNLSVDVICPQHMKNEPVMLGGELLDTTYGEYQEEMDIFNKAFLEVFNKGDGLGRIFSFPIPTYNITEDFPWESEVGQKLMEMTAKYGPAYFQNFINSDLDPSDVKSMCPLPGDTEIFIRNSYGDVIPRRLDGLDSSAQEFESFFEGEWYKSKLNRQSGPTVTVIGANGISTEMGRQHLQVVLRGEQQITVHASEIEPGDYLPFNIEEINSGLGRGDWLMGFCIGAYMGDGCLSESNLVMTGHKSNDVFNFGKYQEFYCKRLGAKHSVSIKEEVQYDHFYGQYVVSFLKQYTSGTSALDKKFTGKAFMLSEQARRGILDGLQHTDGTKNKNRARIYTYSKDMARQIVQLYTSLGVVCSLSEDNRPGRYSNNTCYIVKPVRRKNYTPYYKDGRYQWVQVKEVVKNKVSKNLFCLEVDNEEELFTLASGLITHNCRLNLRKDHVKDHLKKKTGGLFGSGDLTGSIGVVTLNLPQLAYISTSEKHFMKLVEKYCRIAKTSLEVKRKLLNTNLKRGLYPFSNRYLKNGFDGHFSTIGVIGGHEACLNLLGVGIQTDEGKELMMRVLDLMSDLLLEFQEETDNLYNLEATPGEGTSYKLAKNDVRKFPGIVTSGKDVPYYTNSTQLPVHFTDDVILALEHQDDLQTKYTGGTVFHVFLGEAVPDPSTIKTFIMKVFKNTKLPYLSITPTFSICPNHGYLSGEQERCPYCGEQAEVTSRVVGYFRAVNRWNPGKKSEFADRVAFTLSNRPKFNPCDILS